MTYVTTRGRFIVVLLCLSGAAPQDSSGTKVTRQSGGSIRTALSQSIEVNKGSTIEREWITVHNASIPVDLEGTVGVRTVYVPGASYSRGEYHYKTEFAISVSEPIAAINVGFLLFDVWGRHIKTLGSTDIRDFPVGKHELTSEWSLYSENECSEFYASIAYITRIRTASGKVITPDASVVVQEARHFSAKFESSDLEETKIKKE